MEEYIKHIAEPDSVNPLTNRPTKSICGKDIHMDWAFTGIDHAYLSVIHDSRLLPCKDCVKVIIKKLEGKSTVVPHLEALTRAIEESHNYGFDDVLSEYLTANNL